MLDKVTGRISRFRHDPADPHSLGHDYVSAIVEDPSGVLWVGSSFGSGLSALDVKTGRFTRYSFRGEVPGAQGLTGVTELYVDRDGVLWLCRMDRGLLKLDRERRTLFSTPEFEQFTSLVENYAFSEAYEQLLAAGGSVHD